MSGSEENIHYISDQDSNDEKPQIESIIKEKSKIFRNESYVIKILLSDHHRDMRSKFFSNVRTVHDSIYQAIKREIRNCLNPYRIFIGKDTNTSKEVQELYQLLKLYYKEKNFNNTFFINYFKDLENAHKKINTKFINMLPTNEIETLNDLQRKVTIIKALRHYINTTIRDRIQINFEQKKNIFKEDDFNMMYKYLVIKEKEFSEMNEKDLMKYISNKKGSFKLRRPLNDFNVYNYLPILCKGYCQKEAKLFTEFFDRVIQNHAPKCKKCKDLVDNLDEINSQIRSIYVKTCIFSHNINEIMYHPLVFYSFTKTPFYKNELKKGINYQISNLVDRNEPSDKYEYKNLKKATIRMIYNPADVGMKEIYNKLVKYSEKIDLYSNKGNLPEIKTNECPLLFKPKKEDFSIHLSRCPYYHNSLEKRRNIRIKENEICKEVIKVGKDGKDGKWRTDEENIKCKNSDLCNKFHTRNELFFDERNYRKLYPCYPCSNSSPPKYCLKGLMCPRKHAIDIKIDEIYLPTDSKNYLGRELTKLIEKNNKIMNKIERISKIQCKCCLDYIDGVNGNNLYYLKNCYHIICSKCFNFYNSCPLCGLNNNDNNDDEDDYIFIKLDYENKNIKKSDEDSIEEEKYNKEDDSENKEEEVCDDDLKDEDEDYNRNEFNFKSCNEVVYDEDDDEDNNNKSKKYNKKNDSSNSEDNDDNNENSYNNDESYSSSFNKSRGSRGSRGTRGSRVYRVRGRGGKYQQRGRDNNSIFSGNNDNHSRKGYKRGGSKRGSYNEDNQRKKERDESEESNKNSDENEEILENSMARNNVIRGRGGYQRRGGRVRGRIRIRGKGNERDNNSDEEDSKSSDEDNNNSMTRKKSNNDEPGEISD